MADQSARYYRIDPDLALYESFFDHGWAKAFCAQADSCGMGDEAWNICEAWKGAASTARFPWVTVEMMYNLAQSFHMREPYTAEFLRALGQRLASGVEPALTEIQLAAIRTTAHDLDVQLVDTLRRTPVPVDREQMWADLIQNAEFEISILASQRIAFAAVYFGYEDFVLACFKRARGTTDYRIGQKFPQDLAAAFGTVTAERIWNDRPVAVARAVRHAIAHNGCRVTPKLANLQHDVEVIDGRLQITASLTRATFDTLKERATVLLQATSERRPPSLGGVSI